MNSLLRAFFDQEPAVLFHADLETGVTFKPGHARVVFALGAHAFEFTRTRAPGLDHDLLTFRIAHAAHDSEHGQSTGR